MLGREEGVVEGVEGSSDSEGVSYPEKKAELASETLPTTEIK